MSVSFRCHRHLICSKMPALPGCVHAKSLQLCLTLCDPMDCSPPSSSVHGIFQARILELVAIPFSRASSWRRDQTRICCITGRFFTAESLGKLLFLSSRDQIRLLHGAGGAHKLVFPQVKKKHRRTWRSSWRSPKIYKWGNDQVPQGLTITSEGLRMHDIWKFWRMCTGLGSTWSDLWTSKIKN